jgi:hypothetical protein
MVESSGGGFTFETLEECRAAMDRLRLDADLRAALGRRGRVVARDRWSRDAHLRTYLGLVRGLKGGAATPGTDAPATEASLAVGA